ncbi:hypothetical protein H072_8967 [Dactylellina haptotyla CBS 200.50]|uniref:Uncharacterized protein n=1 Tax=Dactylellina haptotyla (strain CBS 200.50) TaxID=1284197 RepID=S8A306_DACHA|nr:hypothetical protein H072_8967 [Dactylellina haptotyla CBS 200.50]
MSGKKGSLEPTFVTHPDIQTGDLLGLAGSSSSSTIPLVPQPEIFTPTTTLAGDDDDLPPSYDAEGTALLSHPSHSVPEGATNSVPLEPPPDFTPYVAETHENPTTGQVTSYDPHLNEDGEALFRFLLTQNMYSPRPQVRMKGTHLEKHHHHHGTFSERRNSSEHRTITDFDITMDFQSLILIEPGQQGIIQTVDEDTKAHRGGVFRTRGRNNKSLPANTPIMPKDIRNWADDYCADPAIFKEFVMEKICPGYDTKYLETRLIQLIQSTNYAGDIQISFPTTHSKVKIRPPNKATELRYNKALRWFCYLTFLWIITWPILFFLTRKYNVVRSVWPMSAVDVNGRRRVKMTEDQWFEYWRLAIRRAVLGRRQGTVTEQDLIELAAEAGMPRMQINTGSQIVDSVLGGAVDLFGAIGDQRRMFGWGRDQPWGTNAYAWGRNNSSSWNFSWGRNEHHWDC